MKLYHMALEVLHNSPIWTLHFNINMVPSRKVPKIDQAYDLECFMKTRRDVGNHTKQ